MRVAVFADDLYPGFGGQAAATEGHIEALVSLGHEVRVLAGAEKVAEQPPLGVLIERLPVWRPGGKQTQIALPRSAEIEKLLRWTEVAQINTPTPLALRVISLARRWNIPTAVGFHTQEESAALHFGPLRRPVSAGLRHWYTTLYGKPDCLLAPTAFAANLATRYTARPIHVVSNGIRLPAIGANEEERAAKKRQKLLGDRRHLLVHVGRLTQEKRPQDLLSVAAALAVRRDDWRLVIAGNGPLRRTLERRCARLGLSSHVDFVGFVPEGEKEDLLLAADLFLMPSPTELQSIATLEAMARRCAVVSADTPTSAVPQMIREADCGICYLPDRLAIAATDIVALLDHPVELNRLRKNAIVAAAEHDLHRSGAKLQEIYTSLLRDRGISRTIPNKPLQRTNR